MPDFAMCNQAECALWMSCYRFRAVPSKPQSYVKRGPAEMQDDGGHFCNEYWPLPYATGPIMSIEELRTAHFWLSFQEDSKELPPLFDWPAAVREEFQIDMAVQGIHHDDYPDHWADWLLRRRALEVRGRR